MTPEATPPETRLDPPFVADERTTVDGFLDYHRETLLWKCSGLTDDQLKSHPIATSHLSLLGLVRHLAEVERGWLTNFTGTDKTWLFCTEDDRDGDFDNVADADVAHDLEVYATEIATYRRELAKVDLDTTFDNRRGEPVTLRWVLCHLVEEYARHNGHADLLREAIDGATGE